MGFVTQEFWEAVCSPSHGGLRNSPSSDTAQGPSHGSSWALPGPSTQNQQGDAQRHRGAETPAWNIPGTAPSYRNSPNSCTSTPKEYTQHKVRTTAPKQCPHTCLAPVTALRVATLQPSHNLEVRHQIHAETLGELDTPTVRDETRHRWGSQDCTQP